MALFYYPFFRARRTSPLRTPSILEELVPRASDHIFTGPKKTASHSLLFVRLLEGRFYSHMFYLFKILMQ